MELWLRRLFWLAALVIGAGGTLVFPFLYGLPGRYPLIIYVYPCTTIALAAIALRGVLRAWRETPPTCAGCYSGGSATCLLLHFSLAL